MNALLPLGWIDRTALGRPANHDDRHDYNPPPVLAPAMTDSQFEFDNEMDKELLRLSNPLVLAREVWLLRERVKELENDNGS